jgi:hypothetical protein
MPGVARPGNFPDEAPPKDGQAGRHYRPKLASQAMTTASGEVNIRLNSTAGVPTSTVSTLASPRPSPTGMKSQPT